MMGVNLNQYFTFFQREHQQKLIYSGRLLNDHLMLKDILRQVMFNGVNSDTTNTSVILFLVDYKDKTV